MSISYNACVVCGFKVDIVRTMVDATKYNPDTGVPYITKVASHEVAMVDGVEVASNKDRPDALSDGETLEGLEFGESGYERGQKWLGVVLAKVSDWEGDIVFKPLDVSIPPAVSAFAEKKNLKPGFFLVMSCA